jgi:hypothetical protein
VRDHDHETMYIRGILCELCNSWLALFECGRAKNRNYLSWASMFEIKILDYLKKSTPFQYPHVPIDVVWNWYAQQGLPSAGSPSWEIQMWIAASQSIAEHRPQWRE